MITIISTAVGFVYGAYMAYREFGHIIEHYKNLADAKNTATKGA
jgi:hypothetical protein